jgi:hypothetical protein
LWSMEVCRQLRKDPTYVAGSCAKVHRFFALTLVLYCKGRTQPKSYAAPMQTAASNVHRVCPGICPLPLHVPGLHTALLHPPHREACIVITLLPPTASLPPPTQQASPQRSHRPTEPY